MSEFPLVVSYYTKDTMYQLEVQNLIASCEQWGLEHHVESISSLGSWERNCCFKPFFLLEKLQQFQRPLFWVDADGVFLKKPQWLEVFNQDAAVRIHEILENSHPSKVISASLFVNASLGAVALLKAWGQGCINAFLNLERVQEVWDQMILRDVILSGEARAQIGTLPIEYLAIQEHSDATVIAHYQASRRFKKIINNP